MVKRINYIPTGWMQSVIKKWAKRNVNVCAVDWGKLSLEALNYFSVAQKSTVRVADFIVDTLLRFENNGVNISETSLAGHSLGAHIVGKVGGSLKTKGKVVGYIYGTNTKDYQPEQRTDRLFIVIHCRS